MTDYRELEQRLRQIADYEVIGNNKQAQVGALRDAADAITALREENERLATELASDNERLAARDAAKCGLWYDEYEAKCKPFDDEYKAALEMFKEGKK